MHHKINWIVLTFILSLTANQAMSAPIYIENASFEFPVIDPLLNPFGAVPNVDNWTEMDNDALGSQNTGVFVNTEPNHINSFGDYDHIFNTDGNQMAFLGSEAGNAFEQDLSASYHTGCDYHLTIAVGTSFMFTPSTEEPIDYLELALYYRNDSEPVDIVSLLIPAMDPNQWLKDFSLYLPTVNSSDPWAGKNIGIAIRAAGQAGGFWDLDNVRLIESLPAPIHIKNASFEFPVIDPLNSYGAGPVVDDWIELDVAPLGDSVNTGVFINTEPNSFDHIVNADANQLAFLFSEQGNALEQDLEAQYKADCSYKFTVAVGVSSRIPPTLLDPVGKLELALYYYDVNEPNQTTDIISKTIEATGLIPTLLQDFSISLPAVNYDANWADHNIGIAIRAADPAGGVWVLDNARLVESLPTSVPIKNASFEFPVIDLSLNPFGADPNVDDWIQLDHSIGNNTGVFANTEPNSDDHIVNADGNQLAFLASVLGDALEQDLNSEYKIGCSYRLSVALCVSNRFPPSDPVELALYYRDANDPNIMTDIVTKTIDANGLLSTQLQGFSLYLPTVSPDANFAGRPIGIAIRATGDPEVAGGFWDLDNVRLGESLPIQDHALISDD